MSDLRPTTSALARLLGEAHYYPAKPCRNGHLSARNTGSHKCLKCHLLHAKKNQQTVSGRTRTMLTAARKRAVKKGIAFGITLNDIHIPAHCPLFGTPLRMIGDNLYNNDSPSLDRIDNTKGYVPGNVAVISLRANKLKSNLTPNELRHFAAALQNYLPPP
jgi:hypothetical protein